MRVPLSWLREYVDVTIPLPDLAERLTLAGLEVDSILEIGAEWDREKIVVGRIVEVRSHPDADRLTIAVVDFGGPQPEAVVTGAPNIRVGDKGQKVAFARAGAKLIDGHAQEKRYVTLKPTKVRGVMSAGMVCSEKELGLSEEHGGILILEEDAPVGVPLRDYLGETILVIELTPNLGRCLSVVGIAREVAALTGQPLKLAEPKMNAEGSAVEGQVRIEISDPDLCPRYSATLVRGIQVSASPGWMQRRLQAAGMRPINNIVDITNYVMLEWGQPLHAFDFDKLHGRQADSAPVIIVRRARPGERLTTLDGVERQLTEGMLLITDGAAPVAIAGVMGGVETEISPATVNVLLEAANFDNINNRRTSELLKLPSEASLRFGRGVPAEMTVIAATRASDMIQRHAGGVIAAGFADAYPVKRPVTTLDVVPRDIERLLGIPLGREKVVEALQAFDFECEFGKDEVIHLSVPYYRLDVKVAADLAEDVARWIGYDRIPATLLRAELPTQRRNVLLENQEKVRDALVGCGLTEVITYSLTNLESVARLDPQRTAVDPTLHVRIANPLTSECEYMRRTLMNSLLETLRDNWRFGNRVALFEIARVYLAQPGQVLPDEPLRLGVVMCGPRELRTWSGTLAETFDFFDLKGLAETVMARLRIQDATFETTDNPTFQKGRVAAVRAGGVSLGFIGEVHPTVRESFDLPAERVCLLELDLSSLLGMVPATYLYQSVSRFPAVTQDLALIVDEGIPAGKVHDAMSRLGAGLLQRIELFDVYRGEPIPPGKKSLAYSLTYQSANRTLTDDEVNRVRERMVKGLVKELGVQVRA